MSRGISFSTVVSMAALVFAFQAFSQTAESPKPMPAKPMTANALLDDMTAQFDNVDKMIKANKLAMVHEHAEIIGNDCKELLTAGLPSDSIKRSKAEGYLKSMEKIAIKLDEYGDANNAKAVESEVKKGRALHDLLVKQYPQVSKQNSDRTKVSETGYWTCPMHPEVHKTAAGQCPICGMNLVFKKTMKPDSMKKEMKMEPGMKM